MGEYWGNVHRQAWARTRKALHIESGERLVVAFVAALTAVAGLFFWGSGDAANDELIARTALATGVVMLFPAFYAWHFARLPSELALAQKQELDRWTLAEASAVERDAYLWDALLFIIYGDWETRIPQVNGANQIGVDLADKIFSVERELRQRALDSKLQVWGMPVGKDLYQPVEASEWKISELGITGFLDRQSNDSLELYVLQQYRNVGKIVIWRGPMVSRAQVEKLWHQKKSH